VFNGQRDVDEWRVITSDTFTLQADACWLLLQNNVTAHDLETATVLCIYTDVHTTVHGRDSPKRSEWLKKKRVF